MIVVKIELWSAITKQATEIGRMYIANAGGSATRGDYDVAVCKRGTTDVPAPVRHDDPRPTRSGHVRGYPRLAYNVWRLISRALGSAFPEERANLPSHRYADDLAEARSTAHRLAEVIKTLVEPSNILPAPIQELVATALAYPTDLDE